MGPNEDDINKNGKTVEWSIRQRVILPFSYDHQSMQRTEKNETPIYRPKIQCMQKKRKLQENEIDKMSFNEIK